MTADTDFSIENYQDEVFAGGRLEMTNADDADKVIFMIAETYKDSKFSMKQQNDFQQHYTQVKKYLVLFKQSICEEYKIDAYKVLDKKEINIVRTCFSLLGFWNLVKESNLPLGTKNLIQYKEDTNFNSFVLNVWEMDIIFHLTQDMNDQNMSPESFKKYEETLSKYLEWYNIEISGNW